MKKFSWILLLPVLFVLTGCVDSDDQKSVGPKVGVITGAKTVAYPALYTDGGLPQYDKAALVQVIKNGPTLKDGVLIRLESTEDVKTIAAFYVDAFTKAGWIQPSVNEPTTTSFATQFNGPDKQYAQITVSQITGQGQTITVNYSQQ